LTVLSQKPLRLAARPFRAVCGTLKAGAAEEHIDLDRGVDDQPGPGR